jgi:hypothetical protein
MANELILYQGDTSIMGGSLTVGGNTSVALTGILQKYSGSGWVDIITIGPFTLPVSANVSTNFSDFGTFEHIVNDIGTYRWKTITDINSIIENSYTYFDVIFRSLPQPTIQVSDTANGISATFSISNSYEYAENKVFVRREGGSYPDEPNFSVIGNKSYVLSLSPGSYYSKVVSKFETLESTGATDPVKFTVYKPVDPSEGTSAPDYKNIPNVNIEAITNTFFGNQFVVYFLKIPQVGHYQDPESKSLRSYNIDRINESIRGVVLPQFNTNMIAVSYFGHQHDYKMGVGDGELGIISVKMKMDRYLNNYTSFLNWQFLKYDWTFGGQNPKNNMVKQKDLEGILIADFLDTDEKVTRQIGFKTIIETVPPLSLAVDGPEEVEFEISLRITDMDLEYFIMGHPISDRQKIL